MPLADGGGEGLYTTYSLIIATFLGTMGLPHVVVRFYTNPDGRAARRTTLVVLVLLGVFYLLPPIYGALGRVYGDELVAAGRSDVLVLELPRLMVAGLGGELLTGLVTAGAFAAFLSTSSGLAIAVAGVLTQDVTARPWSGRRLDGVHGVPGRRGAGGRRCRCRGARAAQRRRRAGGRAGVRGRRVDVLPAAGARHLVARADRRRRGGRAARRRASAAGAAVVLGARRRHGVDGLGAVLLAQPAAWSVPLAFATMIVRLAAHRLAGAGAHPAVHGAAAHAGDAAARPRPAVTRCWPELPRRLQRPVDRWTACYSGRAADDQVDDRVVQRRSRRRRRRRRADSARARSAKCPGARRYGETASPGRTTSAGPRPDATERRQRDRRRPTPREQRARPARGRARGRVLGAGGDHHHRLAGTAPGLAQPVDLGRAPAAGPGRAPPPASPAPTRRPTARGRSRRHVVAGREQQRHHDRGLGRARPSRRANSGSHSSTYDVTAAIPSRSPAAAVSTGATRLPVGCRVPWATVTSAVTCATAQPVAALDHGLHQPGAERRRAAGRPPSRRRARTPAVPDGSAREQLAPRDHVAGVDQQRLQHGERRRRERTSTPSSSTSSPCSSSVCPATSSVGPSERGRQLGLELLDHRRQPGPVGVDRRHAPHLERRRGHRPDAGGEHVGLERGDHLVAAAGRRRPPPSARPRPGRR